MPDVLIRDVDAETLETLKRRAAAKGQSLSETLRETLRAAARPTREEILARADAIRAMTPRRLTDSTPLIREDRDNDEPYR
jgi:plasmid stability protein